MSFTVKQTHFEGPLDLLLDLIEKRKFFVNDVSLAQVADDYIAYVRSLAEFPLADSVHFVLIASTLLLIKSKSLLPTLDLTNEEQASIEDLNRRLQIYERMRDLSVKLRPMFGTQMMFARGERRLDSVFSPDADMTVSNFLVATGRVLANLPKREFLPKVLVDKIMSLEEVILNLTKRVSESLKMSFREFSGDYKDQKINIIVSFLAMLELVKQGIISVTQEKHFADIQMETETIGIPKY